MEILIPGHRNDSGLTRIKHTRETFDHLPPWRCVTIIGDRFYLCGRCFGNRRSGPYTNQAEVWMAGTDRAGNFHHEVVPPGALCADCDHRAWPAD